VDSSGATLDFLLSAERDAAAAKRFLAKALGRQNHLVPRVINSDGHATYPPAHRRSFPHILLPRSERFCMGQDVWLELLKHELDQRQVYHWSEVVAFASRSSKPKIWPRIAGIGQCHI